ncbi:MAG: histidine phosphatase family protein, partial [Deltaproteobacteria bacterium]|nr:histidine phosphatase family protein [Deltaproteobacteria bacterium]
LVQMERMAERLRLVELDAIFSSDLERAKTGGRLIAAHHDVSFHILPELREMHFGDWEGRTLKEIRERFPGELEKRKENLVNYKVPGGGESIGRFSQRIMTCYERLRAEQEGKDMAMVVHGGVNRVILCHALGLHLSAMFNLKQDYSCLNIIDYFEDSTLVRLVNG